jgi:hypothetical protein
MKWIQISFLFIFVSCQISTPVVVPVYVTSTGPYNQTYIIPQRNCSCGYVLDKGVDAWGNYFLDVQNQCSGYPKRFTFTKDEWDKYVISDGICLLRNSSW